METTSAIEAPSKPHRLTFQELALSWQRGIKENNEIKADDPTSSSVTTEDTIAVLGGLNEGVSKFVGDVVAQVQGEHNKQLTANLALVLYETMRESLDPERKVELSEDER